ncbi:diguanylate cyclase/phosphodiesterase with extracellular sensor [Sulfuricurvum kujiense DSM 16994]|uniref:Diguanylate cyclase/phosphodiesterase with extracellular sensor n=1 Tax=Sulfuricurvum kujiense (strain ATCC BAA-921 / DSM 16994 / JCM 11577 / YK-1) TaxID=709032 RepID=E4TY33_SULKY|nr:EAL domain-containing protein [Sulfuricurvum kujiense]ADR33953.1 diguanylate cyclase/phosphodiesterase with extracellular sensor [Sulfuricurvum kujiense DSM 16994]
MIGKLYRSLKLRGKLAFILIAAIIILSVILGLYFDYFLRDNFAKTTQERIDYAFHRFNIHLRETETELRDGIAFIKDDEALLASIELINAYQDKTDYNAVLLDEEKKRLVEELLNRVKLSMNNDIALYDSHDELVAFVTKTSQGYYLAYVSFEKGIPIFFSRYENDSEYTRHPFKPHWLLPYKHVSYYSQKELLQNNGAITYHRFRNDLVIKSHQSLFDGEGKECIAHIEMSHYVSKPYFLSLSKDLGIDVSSQAAIPEGINPSSSDKNTILYDKEDHFNGITSIKTVDGKVYVIAALDKSTLQKLLNENRISFVILILAITFLTLWILKILFNRGVAQPLQALMNQIEKIERHDYSHSSIIHTGDELEAISRSVRRLASTVNEREGALIASQKQLKYLSDTDPLTDLPNRRLFYVLLENCIEKAKHLNRRFGVIFLDLDQFKQVNDTFGHEIGDILLQEVALRLRQTLRDSEILARIGGDEFNILIEGFDGYEEIESIVKGILNSFDLPFLCQDHEIRTTASIGIAIYPEDGQSIHNLIKNADMAMYRSKDKGRNGYSFFTNDLAVDIEEKTMMIHALKASIDKKDEFFLLYQPKTSTLTGKITAVEALLRWNSSEVGKITPDTFIPLAEETGMILTLGAWVLNQACSDFMLLRNEGYLLEHIGVNVSSLQLQRDDFIKTLNDVLDQTKIDPKWLEIELTESYLATDADHALSILRTLRDLNINIAIDDFGTGYSSMAYLQKLSVTRLKIDKSFIDDLPLSSESIAITRAIIALANTFGLSITAEGVENHDQLCFLQDEGCHEIQGYYYSKPLTLNELKDYITNQ